MAFARAFKFCLAASLLAAAVIVPTVAGASAQGLFDFLFGGFRHYRDASRPAPPWGYGYGRPEEPPLFERGYRTASREGAYCVRLCGGSHFPIQARAEMTAGERGDGPRPAN